MLMNMQLSQKKSKYIAGFSALALLLAGCESAGHGEYKGGGGYNREMHMEEQAERL